MAVRIPAHESFCYVTTTGRVTGRPHEIEIWFVESEGDLYLMAGGHDSDWVRNMNADPSVTVRVGDLELAATAEVDPELPDPLAIRRAMAAEYQGWKEGSELSDWARTALIVRLRDLRSI